MISVGVNAAVFLFFELQTELLPSHWQHHQFHNSHSLYTLLYVHPSIFFIVYPLEGCAAARANFSWHWVKGGEHLGCWRSPLNQRANIIKWQPFREPTYDMENIQTQPSVKLYYIFSQQVKTLNHSINYTFKKTTTTIHANPIICCCNHWIGGKSVNWQQWRVKSSNFTLWDFPWTKSFILTPEWHQF